MANNETIKILNGDKIVVNVNTFRHFINELIDRKIKGKGLSTNDFSDELKNKLTKTISIYNSKDLDVENSSLKLKSGDIIYYEANEFTPHPAYTYVANIASEDEVTFGNILTTETLEVYLESFGEILNTKVDKVEGKGLSTNDFTNEDKTKLTSALTSTSIISAGKVSGDLNNSKINLNNIFTERFPGDTRTYGVIPGANVSGTLTNAIMEGSKVSGELTNATINGSQIRGNIDVATIGGSQINSTISGSLITGDLTKALIHADKIGDTIDGGYTLGVIKANRLKGNLTNANIDIERVNGITEVLNVVGGGIAQYQVKANKVYGNLDNAKIQGSNITGYINVSKLQDTINDTLVTGKINAANISGEFLDNVSIPASTIHGKLTNATIDSSNIEGTMTAEQILADHSITSTHLATGAVIPEDIASGNLSSGVKVNVNALVGYIPADKVSGILTSATIKSSQIRGTIDGSKISGTISGAFLDANKIFEINETGFVMGVLKAGRLRGDIDKERMRSGFLELCEEYNIVFNNKGPGIN